MKKTRKEGRLQLAEHRINSYLPPTSPLHVLKNTICAYVVFPSLLLLALFSTLFHFLESVWILPTTSKDM